jgi:lysophospholipase L1-like esterase
MPKSFLRNLFFSGIILIFSLALLEIGVKIYLGLKDSTETIILTHDGRVFDHRPSFSFVNKHGFEVCYNSLGFIGPEIPNKEKDALRILILGDSITVGTYISAKNRYTALLEEILNKRINRNIEVINGAVSGYNTWQEVAMLKARGLKVRPDVVIVGICLNDFVKTIPVQYLGIFGRLIPVNINDGSKARYLDFLYQRSSLYRIIYDKLSILLRDLKNKDKYNKYLRDYNFSISQEEWILWRSSLKEMHDLCSRNRIKLVFAIFPLHVQLVQKKMHSYEPLTEFMKNNEFYFIDLIETFKMHYQNGESIYLERDIIHPNELGHKVTADALAQYLIENEIL